MPNLLLFAPCQKAILDKNDNTVSLIGLMHGLVINPEAAPANEPIPSNAVIPLQWAIVTVWLRSLDDEEKTFEQLVNIITPNNIRILANTQPFQMTQRTHQIIMAANTFPIGEAGEYKLTLSLREIGKSDWKELATYPIEIKHAENQLQKAG